MFLKVGKAFSYAGQTFQKAVGWQSPVPKDLLHRALFGNGFVLSKGGGLFSGHGMSSNYMSTFKNAGNLTATIVDQIPGNGLHGVSKVLAAEDLLLGYHAFGSISGLSFFLGASKIHSGITTMLHSNRIQDRAGSLIGFVSLVVGTSKSSSGVSSIFYKLFSAMKMINVPELKIIMGRVSSVFSKVGLVFYMVFFASLVSVSGIKLYEGHKLRNKLKGGKDLAEQVEILQKKLHVDQKKLFQKLVEKQGSEEAARKVLIDEAFQVGEENLKKLLKELNIKNVSEDKLKELVHQAVESGVSGQIEEQLMQIGLQKKVQNTQQKRYEKMGRIFDKKGIAAMHSLQAARGLANRVRLGDKEAIHNAEILVKAIKRSNHKMMIESASVISVLLLGVVAMIFSSILTGGIGLIVSGGLMLAFSILSTAVDGYYLFRSYSQARPTSNDKKMLLLSSFLGLASMMTVVGLSVSGVVSIGIFPLVISLLFGAAWLGQNAVTWAVMNRNERRYHEKNPTFEKLLEALNADKSESVSIMLKNLSEIQREMIDAEMKKHEGDQKEAVRAVIQKVEFAKKAHLDSLRETITPHLVKVSAG